MASNKWAAIFEAGAIVFGAALAIGLVKRTKVVEKLAVWGNVSEKNAGITASAIRTAAPILAAAVYPPSTFIAIPLFFASLSEGASTLAKASTPVEKS